MLRKEFAQRIFTNICPLTSKLQPLKFPRNPGHPLPDLATEHLFLCTFLDDSPLEHNGHTPGKVRDFGIIVGDKKGSGSRFL